MAGDERGDKIHKNAALKQKEEVIEIPIGDYISKVRKNPWIAISVILFIALVALFFWKSSLSSEDIVSEKVAAQNVISLINSQGRGTAELISTKRVGPFYEVDVKYNGGEIPVHATLDGNFIIINLIPITPNAPKLAQPKTIETTTETNINKEVEVNIEDSPAKGNKNSKVIIVEFTDYQCSACKQYFESAYSEIIKDYVNQGKVLYVIKDFPDSTNPESQKAAESARCVREQQGDIGYFRMHDKLFENQGNLSFDKYLKLAGQVGVISPTFGACLEEGKYASAVKADLEYGQSLGISETPAFFVNGNLIPSTVSFDDLKKIIGVLINSTA